MVFTVQAVHQYDVDKVHIHTKRCTINVHWLGKYINKIMHQITCTAYTFFRKMQCACMVKSCTACDILLSFIHRARTRQLTFTCHVYCAHEDRKAYLACNFNCLFENEGFLKVTAHHIHPTHVVVSWKRIHMESLLLLITNRKWYMAYGMEAIPMNDDLEWLSMSFPTMNDLNVIFHKAMQISSYIARRAVPLRQPSLL